METLNFFKNMYNELPEIVSIGSSIYDPIWNYTAHINKDSELMFVINGECKIWTETYTINANKSDIIFIPSNTLHRDIFKENTELEICLVQFKWKNEKLFLENFNPVNITSISKISKKQIEREIDFILKEFSRVEHLELISLSILKILTSLIVSVDKNKENIDNTNIRRNQIMENVKNIIKENYHKSLTLNTISEMLNLSPFYVSRVFNLESGFKLSEYLTKIRMEKAADLLTNSNLNISEIAYKVGYLDNHYFTNIFKSYYEMTPKSYRSKYKQ